MRAVRGIVAALVAMSSLTLGGLAGPAAAETSAQAVVAFIDTGINPYHLTFRDSSPLAQQHPSTYLPGFPADAQALRLTLDDSVETWEDAVAADCAVWKGVRPGQLYWVPGTKIVGAISFAPAANAVCTATARSGMPILDLNGHGTMVASRAASIEYGACKSCRVVAVQHPSSVNLLNPGASTEPSVKSIEWAAANASWIDAQSNSWGPIVPGYDPTGAAGLLTASPRLVRAVEATSSRHFSAWASGNGAAFRGGVLGHPSLLTPHAAPSAVIVGGHDSGYVNVWPGFPPHVVSDSCASWAARHNKIADSGDSVGGGTSAATPFVAGGAAQILLEARRILGATSTGVLDGVVASGAAGVVASGPLADGTFTLAEWKRLVFTTATARPVRQYEDGPTCATGQFGPTPVQWKDVPAQYPEFLHIGYGAVDTPAVDLAGKVLRGEAPAPDRARTDQYFAADAAARGALHQVFRGPGL